MPFSAGDAKRHKKGLSPSQASAWAKIANNALKACQSKGQGDCEGRAIRIANAGVERVGKIAKFDEDKRLAFGWAYVVKQEGEHVIDHSEEFIESAEELEDPVYDYVKTSRIGNDMHGEDVHGQLVESVVFTPAKWEALGVTNENMPEGWWVGMEFDQETFDKIKAGDRRMFSIEGEAVRVEV